MTKLLITLFTFAAACGPVFNPTYTEEIALQAPQARFPFLEVIDGVTYMSASLHIDAVRYPNEDAIIWPTLLRGHDLYLSSFVKTPHGVLGTAYITQRLDETSETVFSWLSDDAGASWRSRVGVLRLPRPQAHRDANWGGLLMHRGMLALGSQLCGPAYGGYKGDAKYRSVWVCSSDEGLNWDVISTIAYSDAALDEGFGEPVVTRAGENGPLVTILRTGRDLLHTSQSYDQGVSWSSPIPIKGTWGTYDPDLVWLVDRLLLVFGNGSSNVRAKVSNDDGATWQQCPDIVFDSQSSGYVGVRAIDDKLLVVTDGHSETTIVSKYLPLDFCR